MNEFPLRALLTLAFSLGVGMLLGGVFYGGLWWTIQRAVSSTWVSLWFLLSLLVRTVIVMVGLYWACGPDWRRWAASLLGFVLARLWAARLAPAPVSVLPREVGHAS